MNRHSRTLRVALAVAGTFLLLAMPGIVTAHSELETSTPADGETVDGSPAEIVLTFSETLDPAKSSISLRDASGTEVASARVDPNDDTVMRLTPRTLAPGPYEIRWTSVAEDGDLLRGTVHFQVAAVAAPSPTTEPSAPPTASPEPSVAPSPSPSSSGSSTASSSDVILPIVAAIVLIAVLGAWLLNRARGTRP